MAFPIVKYTVGVILAAAIVYGYNEAHAEPQLMKVVACATPEDAKAFVKAMVDTDTPNVEEAGKLKCSMGQGMVEIGDPVDHFTAKNGIVINIVPLTGPNGNKLYSYMRDRSVKPTSAPVPTPPVQDPTYQKRDGEGNLVEQGI